MVPLTTGQGHDDGARIEALVEHAFDAIVVTDARGVITYASPAIRTTLGYDPSYLVGRHQFELLPPEDVPASLRDLADLLESPGAVTKVSFRNRHADGSLRTFRGIARNLLDVPEVAGIVVNSIDVTEHLRAEQSLREMAAVIDASADAIFGSTLDGTITETPTTTPLSSRTGDAVHDTWTAEPSWRRHTVC